jgi:tetratricopeptide (TPR) repeat protein
MFHGVASQARRAVVSAMKQSQPTAKKRGTPLPSVEPKRVTKDARLALLLVAATVVAYLPALHGGFIWDDDIHIWKNPSVRSPAGLWEIWFKHGATPQFYPLTFTFFWVEYQLWGTATFGYHLVTLLLHGVVAVLLWQVLKSLKVRGALFAGAIFALHPVNVMSAAWLTELKNTLSATLALGAGWMYLRFACVGVYEEVGKARPESSKPDWFPYISSLALFQIALLAKTAVSFLPLSLFLVLWWQRKGARRRDVLGLLPMFGIAVLMAMVTSGLERHEVGAAGDEFDVTFLDRVLVSGRSFWFYLGKLFFPHRLTFIYERWKVDSSDWRQYLYPAATISVLVGAWSLRKRIGRGVFVGLMHFYISTSMLILFLVLYMTRYSFVSDHWQYFGCMGVIAVFASGVTTAFDALKPKVRLLGPAVSAALLLMLGALTLGQCGMYKDIETLWRTTIARNPRCWMAYSNLGFIYIKSGREREAFDCYEKALEIRPQNAQIHYVLGNHFLGKGDAAKAISEFERAVEIDPTEPDARINLATAYFSAKRTDEAIGALKKALELKPGDAMAEVNLGNMLLQKGNWEEAVSHFHKALESDPELPDARSNLVKLLLEHGRVEEAIAEYEAGLKTQPRDGEMHVALAKLLLRTGKWAAARSHCESALGFEPMNPSVLSFVAWVLATCPEATVRDGPRALELSQRAQRLAGGENVSVLPALAASYAEDGQLAQAIAVAEQGARAAAAQTNSAFTSLFRMQLDAFRSGVPFRDRSLTNPGGDN